MSDEQPGQQPIQVLEDLITDLEHTGRNLQRCAEEQIGSDVGVMPADWFRVQGQILLTVSGTLKVSQQDLNRMRRKNRVLWICLIAITLISGTVIGVMGHIIFQHQDLSSSHPIKPAPSPIFKRLTL